MAGSRRRAAPPLRAVDRAYEAVRSGIVRGRYPPASRITEHQVAAAAGVSRTPAREALRRLNAEGLVEFTPNQGAVVTAWSQEDAEEMFDLRAALEALAAARAARRASAVQRGELRRLAEQQRAEAERRELDRPRLAELNRRFHERLTAAAASPCLTRTLGALLEATLIVASARRASAAEHRASAEQHLELVRALEARDEEWAGAVMRAHVLAAKRAGAPRQPA